MPVYGRKAGGHTVIGHLLGQLQLQHTALRLDFYLPSLHSKFAIAPIIHSTRN